MIDISQVDALRDLMRRHQAQTALIGSPLYGWPTTLTFDLYTDDEAERPVVRVTITPAGTVREQPTVAIT